MTDKPQETGPESQEQGREQELCERERALTERELRLNAREEILRRGLPEELAALIDHSSREALDRSLALADRLIRHKGAPDSGAEAPKAAGGAETLPRTLSYAQRASLYLIDREGYQEAFGGRK